MKFETRINHVREKKAKASSINKLAMKIIF